VLGGLAAFFLIALNVSGPVSDVERAEVYAGWGISWLIAYAILFLGFRAKFKRQGVAIQRTRLVPGRRLAGTSAVLLGIGFFLFVYWVFDLSCVTAGGLSCTVPSTIPGTFGLLTILEFGDLIFLLVAAGIVLLALAIRRQMKWQRLVAPPVGAGPI
jgi:hypothetical protein